MSDELKISCASCFHFKENICRKHGFYFKDAIAIRSMCEDWYHKPKEASEE